MSFILCLQQLNIEYHISILIRTWTWSAPALTGSLDARCTMILVQWWRMLFFTFNTSNNNFQLYHALVNPRHDNHDPDMTSPILLASSQVCIPLLGYSFLIHCISICCVILFCHLFYLCVMQLKRPLVLDEDVMAQEICKICLVSTHIAPSLWYFRLKESPSSGLSQRRREGAPCPTELWMWCCLSQVNMPFFLPFSPPHVIAVLP